MATRCERCGNERIIHVRRSDGKYVYRCDDCRNEIPCSSSHTTEGEVLGWDTPSDDPMDRCGFSHAGDCPPDEEDEEWIVAVYEVSRNYGGPEEGGWWYDSGTLILTDHCESEDQAKEVREALRNGEFQKTSKRYSVLGGDDYDVEIYHDKTPPKFFPAERPRYE